MYNARYVKPLKSHSFFTAEKGGKVSFIRCSGKKPRGNYFPKSPFRNETKRKEVAEKTDWGGMATITRERLEKGSRSRATSRASPVCQQNIIFSVIYSQVTQMSEITLSVDCNIPIISVEAIVDNTSLSTLNSALNFHSGFCDFHGMRLTSRR